jgi:hypothetical protein
MSSRLLCVATLVLAIVLSSSAAQGIVIVMKEGSALTTGGALNAVFSGVTAADVVQVAVDDTAMVTNPAANYAVQGAATTYSPTSLVAMLFKFDLSSLAGATIEKAQIRFYAGNGNTGQSLARVVTHDWTEALATKASYNGLPSPNMNWGPASNALYSNTADLGTGSTLDSAPVGAAFSVEDVTANVQAFVNGTLPNYGWALYSGATSFGNRGYIPSENADDGRRPALFISYTPVPEPATLAFLAMSGLVLLRRRIA